MLTLWFMCNASYLREIEVGDTMGRTRWIRCSPQASAEWPAISPSIRYSAAMRASTSAAIGEAPFVARSMNSLRTWL